MKLSYSLFISFCMVLFIAGCGSSQPAANGNTVSVTAGISPNTTGSVFSNISASSSGASVFTASPMSITLTAVAINSSGTVPTSSVIVESISMSLMPLPYASNPPNITNALSPTIANPQYTNIAQGVGGVIPGPGSLKIDGIDLLGINDGAVLINAFNTSGFITVQYKYTSFISFHCVEANTGTRFTVTTPIGIVVDL